jgi:hypothetical protein
VLRGSAQRAGIDAFFIADANRDAECERIAGAARRLR